MNTLAKILLGVSGLIILVLQFVEGDQFRRDFISGVLIVLMLVGISINIARRPSQNAQSH